MRAHVDVDEVVELTAALVAVDTRNPPGNERPIEAVVRDRPGPLAAGLDRGRARPRAAVAGRRPCPTPTAPATARP